MAGLFLEPWKFDNNIGVWRLLGRTAVDRLIHITATCPNISYEAAKLAVNRIQKSRDPGLYQTLLNAYDVANTGNPNKREPPQLDLKWASEAAARNQSERAKLEVELKQYTNNMIKESIRVSNDTALSYCVLIAC